VERALRPSTSRNVRESPFAPHEWIIAADCRTRSPARPCRDALHEGEMVAARDRAGHAMFFASIPRTLVTLLRR
jgi:hypothetical protein